MKTGKLNVSGLLDAVQPSFRAYMSAAQSFASDWTLFQFNAESWDTHGWYDTANYRYVPQSAGKYLVSAQYEIALLGENNALIISVYDKDGNTILGSVSTCGSTYQPVVSVCGLVSMNGSTDSLRIYGYHTTGSSKAITLDSYRTWFSAVKVSS